MGVWFWLFFVSATINIVSVVYIRWLLKMFEAANTDMLQINNLILEFSSHLKSVYELEMFYGDETLKSLMDHASQLSINLQNLDLIINEESEEEEIATPEKEET